MASGVEGSAVAWEEWLQFLGAESCMGAWGCETAHRVWSGLGEARRGLGAARPAQCLRPVRLAAGWQACWYDSKVCGT